MVPILLAASALIVALALSAVAFTAAVRAFGRLDDKNADPQSAANAVQLNEIAAKLAALEVKVEGLPSLWADERRRAENAWASARAAKSAATRAKEGEPAGEAEADDEGEVEHVLPIDAHISGPSRVQQLQEGVAAASLDDVKAKAAALGL